jgi:hypothetical protein
MRSGSESGKYIRTIKEFKLEELLQDTLPNYFINTNIE